MGLITEDIIVPETPIVDRLENAIGGEETLKKHLKDIEKENGFEDVFLKGLKESKSLRLFFEKKLEEKRLDNESSKQATE